MTEFYCGCRIWVCNDDFCKTTWRQIKKTRIVSFIMTLKTVIFVLVQIEKVIVCKKADFFVFIGYSSLMDILLNARNWSMARTEGNNVFPYFINSTETWSFLNPSRFRPAETWCSSFPWMGRVSVMFPSRKRTITFPPHFYYHISVLSCSRYLSRDVFFKPMSKIAW